MKQPKNISRLQKIYSILFLLLPLFAMAGEEFDDDTNDVEPPAPIDDYILLAILIGIYIAYRFLKPTLISKQITDSTIQRINN